MNSIIKRAGEAWDIFLAFLFPPMCAGCGRHGELVCEPCLQTIVLAPSVLEGNRHSLFPYRNEVIRRAVWLLKYKNRQDIARFFGKSLHDTLLEIYFDEALFLGKDPIYVIPIPLSKKRLKERGYNQAELIARAMITCDTKNLYQLHSHILIKSSNTPRQAHLKNRTARLKNIRGSMSVKTPEKIQGKRIIVIDDVTTTGATLLEARRVLRSAGAKEVTLWAVAN